MIILLALLCFIEDSLASQVRYDGYQVLRVTPESDLQVEAVRTLEKFNSGFSFWSDVIAANRSVDIMVPPHLKLDFEDFTDLQNLDARMLEDNFQDKIDKHCGTSLKKSGFDFTDYYRLENIYAWFDQLAAQYPDKVKIVVGGRTYEKREIKGVHVSFSKSNSKKAVFIEGGIHAREWISPATVSYILNEILASNNSEVRNMAERYDWYIFPVFNADGYEYSHTKDRLWRKTRVPYIICYGADANRNWAYKYNSGGTSSNPCSETYRGPHAFSEPCTKSLSEYISTIQDKLIAYISFHSYSQLLLIPYGHSPAHVENYDDLYEVGVKAANSLSKRHGTKYNVGNIVEVLYVASGGSMDWVKATYGTPITYTYELRDTGGHGFCLPKEQIIPTGEETLDSLVTIMDEFHKNNITAKIV